MYLLINLLKYCPLSSKFLKLSKDAAAGLNKIVFFGELSFLISLNNSSKAFFKSENFLSLIFFFSFNKNFF